MDEMYQRFNEPRTPSKSNEPNIFLQGGLEVCCYVSQTHHTLSSETGGFDQAFGLCLNCRFHKTLNNVEQYLVNTTLDWDNVKSPWCKDQKGDWMIWCCLEGTQQVISMLFANYQPDMLTQKY